MCVKVFGVFAILVGLLLIILAPYISITCVADNKRDCLLTVSTSFPITIFGTTLFILGVFGLIIKFNAVTNYNTNTRGYFVHVLDTKQFEAIQQ